MVRVDDINGNSGNYVKLRNIYIPWTDYQMLCRHVKIFCGSLEVQSSDNNNAVKTARRTVLSEPVEILFAIVGKYRPYKKIFGELLFLSLEEFELDRTLTRKLSRLRDDIIAMGFVSTEENIVPRAEFRRFSVEMDSLFSRPLYYIVFTPTMKFKVYTNGEFHNEFFKPVDDENELA